MIYGSVCSGIEAASLAWEPLGWEPAWFSEVESFPGTVLAERWPYVSNEGDMLSLAKKILHRTVEAPDVLVGGTPCQSFSVAGTRGSLTDARGNLALAFVKLADAIDKVRFQDGKPECIVVWENVPGVLTTSDNAFGCLLAGLAGDDVPCLPGPLPEDRKNSRFYRYDKKINAHVPKWPKSGCVFGPRRAVSWRVLDAQYFGVAQRRRRVFVVASARDGFDPAAVLFERESVRRDTAPSRETGEGFTYDVAPSLTSSGRGVERPGESRGQDPIVASPVAPTLRAGGNSTGGTAPGTDVDTCDSLIVTHGCFWNGEQVTQTLDAVLDKGQMMPEKNRFPAVIQSVHGTQDPDVCDIAHPLGRNTGQENALFGEGLRVRRLMPVECERLQGMPDDHTNVTVRGKPAADGPRYKSIGNSMAVPCMAFIGKRINQQLGAHNE